MGIITQDLTVVKKERGKNCQISVINSKIHRLFMYGWQLGDKMSAVIGNGSVYCCVAKICINNINVFIA